MKKKDKKNLCLCICGCAVLALSSFGIMRITQAPKAEDMQAKQFFTAVENAEIIENYQAPVHIGDYKGLFVKSPDNGDSIVELTHDLDLRVFERKDVLLKVIPITSAPIDKEENREIDSLTITLTDVEDESRNININVIASENGITPDRYGGVYPYASYVKAAGDGQVMTGYYNKQYYKNEYYGTGVHTNFFGRVREGTPQTQDINPLAFMYDYASTQLHVSPAAKAWESTMVADLSDTENMEGAWDGFSSGKVRMRITATSSAYHNKNSGFLILQVGNINFSQESWADTEAPRLTVDLQGYEKEALPNGQIFQKYPLFNATAYDLFDASYGEHRAEKDVAIRVTRVIDGKEYPIENNAFVPQAIGQYSIVYSTTDVAGNDIEKVFYVDVQDVHERMSHAWDTPLWEEITVGETYTLPTGTVENGYGNVHTRTEVFFTKDNAKILLDKGGFIPEKQGEYRIKVTATDYLERESVFNYYIQAKVAKTPILRTYPKLPLLLFEGKPTALPDFEAYDYSLLLEERVDALKEYVIYDSNGEVLERVKPEELFIPTAMYSEEVTIECVVKNVLYEESKSFTQKAKMMYAQNTYEKGEYFVKEGIDSVVYDYMGEKNITFFFSQENASLHFGNPLPLKNLETNFRIPETDEDGEPLNAYTAFRYTFTDWKDSTKTVELLVENSGQAKKANVYINGKFVSTTSGDFVGNEICFSVNKFNEVVDASGRVLCTIGTYATGDKFEGFNDGLCYLTLQMLGVEGRSAFQVLKIGNHWLNDDDNDFISPIIALLEPLQVEQYVGTVRIAGAVASDVLKGKTDVKVQVISSKDDMIYDGIIDANAVELTINTPGTYSLYYTASDGSNMTTEKFSIYVYSKGAPQVSLNGEVPKTGKVGELIKLPTLSYKGSISNLTTVIYVVAPNGSQTMLEGELSFQAKKAGTYQVVYYVVEDVSGSYNYQLFNYQIQVGG
jgi:hypothetical protein